MANQISRKGRLAERKSTARGASAPDSAPSPRERQWLLLGIYLPILLGAAARFVVVNDVRFTGEEALFYSEAHKIARGEGLPWYGPRMSGSGYHPGPLFFVVCAIPLLVGDEPALVHAWLILLNMAAMLLFARLVRRLHGVRAAAIVTMMLASSPWQFVYSIGIWQPHVMLPIFVVALWCLDRMKQRPRSWAIALLLPLLAASFQIHPSCIMVWLLAGAVILIQRPAVNWRAAGLGMVLSLGAYAPYLAHESKTGFENTRRVATDAAKYAWSLSNPARAFAHHFLMTSSNINFHIRHGYWEPVPDTLGSDLRAYWRAQDPALRGLGWAWPVFAVGNLATAVLAAGVAAVWLGRLASLVLKRGFREMDALTLAFLACPLILFGVVLFGRKPVYPNYVLFVMVAPFVGYAILDRMMGRAIKPKFNVVVPVLAAVLFLPRLGVAVAYVKEIDSRRGLAEQKTFARWVSERGPLKNVVGLEWYNSGVKEPIPVTLARCRRPELLKNQAAHKGMFSLAAEPLETEDARRAYLAKRVKGQVQVVDFQVNARTTFLQWTSARRNN